MTDRWCGKGVSSLQEPPGASISARNPLFRTTVRAAKCNFVKAQKKFTCKQIFQTTASYPGNEMIITLSTGRKINTETDLSAEERHIVQKLYAWASVLDSKEAFREKRTQALEAGWNFSGPVAQRQLLREVLDDIEKKIKHP
jgi:hypothetical protein